MSERKLSVSIGITKNLGNYESLRLDASDSKTFDDSVADPKDVYKELWDSVDEQMEEKIREANGDLENE